jgi:putative oxidoreductase
LQRLFSTFPDGWPGFGLLLLRLNAGISLLYLALGDISSQVGQPGVVARDAIAIAGAIFLLLGLWTPAMAAVTAVGQLWILVSVSSRPDGRLIHVLFAVLAAAVAMLGPGAWSIDARLFGRKRFELSGGSRGRKP